MNIEILNFTQDNILYEIEVNTSYYGTVECNCTDICYCSNDFYSYDGDSSDNDYNNIIFCVSSNGLCLNSVNLPINPSEMEDMGKWFLDESLHFEKKDDIFKYFILDMGDGSITINILPHFKRLEITTIHHKIQTNCLNIPIDKDKLIIMGNNLINNSDRLNHLDMDVCGFKCVIDISK